MGILKDHLNETQGYRAQARLISFADPREWVRLHKYRKQRANRGWSDRDTWNMGDHVANLVVEMLEHLRDNGVTDWNAWFEYNIDEKGKGAYKNLDQVISDIKNYLEHEKTSWTDGITMLSSGELTGSWVDEKTGKKQTSAAIKHRINKWHKENNKLYKKATKAMGFFGRHFAQFWD